MANKRIDWTRDEIILVLDLYFDPNRGSIDSRNPKVIALSKLLQKLPIHPLELRPGTFRNANGVSLKLSNFLAVDPTYKKKGMKSVNGLDQKVLLEFLHDKENLHQIAQQIKLVTANESLFFEVEQVEDEEDGVFEGRILYRLHKARERNKKIVADKKKQAMKKHGKLACELCSFDFHATYGETGKGFIECHHKQPLASLPLSKTTIDDLMLVCSNCHRMLHRNMGNVQIRVLA